jgi:hypothetical protein
MMKSEPRDRESKLVRRLEVFTDIDAFCSQTLERLCAAVERGLPARLQGKARSLE